MAERDGELYPVAGPTFHSTDLRSIRPDGVLVPSSTWKPVYDARRQGTRVYVCRNNKVPTCEVVSVRVLVHAVGLDPFPELPDAMKQQAISLPPPDANPYAHGHRASRHRESKGLLKQLLNP